jgi:hypothetical protein
MVYRGLVRGGVVVIDGDVALPEGTAVTIEAAAKMVEAPPGAPPGRSPDGVEAERVDRLLGGLGQTSVEQMRAQQRLDRFL